MKTKTKGKTLLEDNDNFYLIIRFLTTPNNKTQVGLSYNKNIILQDIDIIITNYNNNSNYI